MKSKSKNNAIEFYRYFFCCIIFILHFRSYGHFSSKVGWFNGGYLGVEFFFIVSGFLLMSEIDRKFPDTSPEKAFGNFLIKKYIRCYPQFFISWIVVLLLNCITAENYSLFWNFAKAIPELMCIQAMLSVKSLSVIYWFVSALIWGSAIVYYLLRKNKDVMAQVVFPLLFLLFLGWAYKNFGTIDLTAKSKVLFAGLIRGIAEIGWGCSLFAFVERAKQNGIKIHPIISGFIEIFLLISVTLVMYKSRREFWDFIAIFAVSLLIALTFLKNSFITSILNNKVSAFLGSISYSMYVCQWIVVIISKKYYPNLPFWTAVCINLTVLTLMGYLLEKFVKIITPKFSRFIQKFLFVS